MPVQSEREIADEVRAIMTTNLAQLFLWQGDPEEFAMCCEHHADMLPILEDHARKYPPAALTVENIKARVAARAASKAAGAAIDAVLALTLNP